MSGRQNSDKGAVEQMKRFHMRIQLTKAGKKAVACAVAGAAVLALLLFFVLFRVTTVEVVGSTRYTDKQIRGYAMDHPLTSNTLLVILFITSSTSLKSSITTISSLESPCV